MKTSPFEANIRSSAGLAIIDLSGEINAFADEALNQAYAQAENLDQASIALNFKDVTYINSTGIALIVGLMANARKSHKHLVVFGLSDHYVEIFQITRLSDFMSIYPDEATTLAEAAQ